MKGDNEKKADDSAIEKESLKDLQNILYSTISSKNFNETIKSFEQDEQIDIIDILLSDIFDMAKITNLANVKKKELNDKMNLIFTNVIKPLINNDSNLGTLECIQRNIITKENLNVVFNKNSNPVLNNNNIKLIYDSILGLTDSLRYKNSIQNFSIFNIIIQFIKDFKRNDYYGSDEADPIKYAYEIFNNIIENNFELRETAIKENLILVLIKGIENENQSNQSLILNIIENLIKSTEDYNKKLFYLGIIPQSQTAFLDKNEVKKLIRYSLIELLFDKNNKLLNIFTKIFQFEDQDFTEKFIEIYLPQLAKLANRTDRTLKYIDLCYNIIDIKDKYTLYRLKLILGYPSLIIKPLKKEENNNKDENENKGQKWPLFGSELIKNNNNNLNIKIYKYISLYKKHFCILSYLLPCTSEINSENQEEFIKENDLKALIYQIIMKCFSSGGNYCLYKYLYLLPARSLNYKNAFEELYNSIKEEQSYDFSIKDKYEKNFIDKINYELKKIYNKKEEKNEEKEEKIEDLKKPLLHEDLKEYNEDIIEIQNFIGLNPDYIPGEIIKEKFEVLVKEKFLELIRIEYITKSYTLDELKNNLNENMDNNLNNKDNNKSIEIDEKFDEKENIIKVDISNKDYQKDENELITKIADKLVGEKKLIIEDGLIEDDNKGISTLIRYILLSKKPFKNIMDANIGVKKDLKEEIKDNICLPGEVFDFVDKRNYVDFLDINRIKKDGEFIQKDDIFIRIDSSWCIDGK